MKLKAHLSPASGGLPDENDPAAVRHVDFVPTPPLALLVASPAAGIVPLEVRFSVRSETDDITRFELDLDGDGQFERSFSTIPEDLTFSYATAGIRMPALRVTTAGGATRVTRTMVNAQTWRVMDGVIQDVWRGFTWAMMGGDVAATLGWLSSDATREKYRPQLETIRSALPRFASEIGEIRPVWLSGDVARYLALRVENGVTAGYHVYFVRAGDGRWKVSQF